MGFLKKVGKKIARGFRKVGRALKKGLGKIGKAFGKLGPLGSLALSFMLPGIGTWLTTGPLASVVNPILNGISSATNFIKGGVKTVFGKVTDAIEYGMNAVSKPFMKEGARGAGSAFRDYVSEMTGGIVDRSTVGLKDDAGNLLTDDNPFTKDGVLKDISSEELSTLQDRNKFIRDVEKFETSKTYKNGNFTKVKTDTGFEYYETKAVHGKNVKVGEPVKVINETTAEEAIKAATETKAGVKSRYAKIQAVSSASDVYTQQEEAEQFNQAYRKQEFADLALENLQMQNSRQLGMGVAPMSFIDLDRAGNSVDPSMSIYNDILQGISLPSNTTPQQVLSQINTYPYIT